MAPNISVIKFEDATGGLNLRANQFTLAKNESPDLLNVDVDPRGGFRLRKGVEPWGVADAGTAIHSLIPFTTSTGTAQLVAGWGTTTVKYTTGATWSTIKTDQTVSRPFSAYVYLDTLFIQNGTDQPIKWTGSAASRLTQSFADDFDAPGSGKQPIARCTAVFHEHIFLANTYESSVRYPNRVRWSHPGNPEAWRTVDYQPIEDGLDGDEIMAMASFGDQLLVLKKNSTHVVMGYAWDSFQFDNVASGVGACGPKAWCVTPGGVYYWSWPEGPVLFDGKGVSLVGERLRPLMDENIIDSSRRADITMGYIDNRVWCTVPVRGTQYETYVYDPSVGRQGAWVRYDLAAGDYARWQPDGAAHAELFSKRGSGHVLRADTVNHSQDVLTVGGANTNIAAHYVTPWFDGGSPPNRKRWRRPVVVYYVEGLGDVTVSVFYDYDASDPRRSTHHRITAENGSAVFDTAGSVFDGTDDDDLFAAAGANHRVVRGASLGSARAVQLRFDGPVGPVLWGVDSISLPVIPRRIH